MVTATALAVDAVEPAARSSATLVGSAVISLGIAAMVAADRADAIVRETAIADVVATHEIVREIDDVVTHGTVTTTIDAIVVATEATIDATAVVTEATIDEMTDVIVTTVDVVVVVDMAAIEIVDAA